MSDFPIAVLQERAEAGTSLCVDETGALLPADTLAEWLQAADALASLCKQFKDDLKAAVEENGTMRLEQFPEMALTIVERAGRASIDAKAAMPVLSRYFSQDEMGDFVTVQKGAMEKALRAKTHAGSKDGKVAEINELLELSGALTRGAPSRSLKLSSIQDLEGVAS